MLENPHLKLQASLAHIVNFTVGTCILVDDTGRQVNGDAVFAPKVGTDRMGINVNNIKVALRKAILQDLQKMEI